MRNSENISHIALGTRNNNYWSQQYLYSRDVPIIEFSVVPSDKFSKIKVSQTLSSRCKSINNFLRYLTLSATLARMITVDTGRKLNVHKTFRRLPGRPMYVQFMSCVYGDRYYLMPLSFVLGECNAKKQFHQKFYKIIYFFAKFDIS